jgi:phospholipase C
MMLTNKGKALLAGAALGTFAAFLGSGSLPAWAADRPAGLDKIKHIVVIYLENRSFDNMFGLFPGANGIAHAGAAATQVDRDGKPYATLPPVMNASRHSAQVDPRFPKDLPNGKPFPIDKYVPIDQPTGDLVHRFYQEQEQIDGGKMDKFVAYSDASTLSLGYYADTDRTSLWRYAKRYTLADNFFHAAFGGSFLNHMWLVCACTPRYAGTPPASIVAKLDANGHMVKDGALTPDGYAVNTIFTVYTPHPNKIADAATLLPPLEGYLTIGDQLSERGISWAWYSGGWNDALAGHPDPLFQFHHQALAYFKQFANGTDAKKRHLKDESDLVADLSKGRLPSVVFWEPIGAENQHPGYAELIKGDHKVDQMIKRIRKSRYWKDSVIIVTYDENGGFWDHVAPPRIDKWGPGSRTPAIIISPFAKRGYVDHTQYDTTSILKLIHERFHIAPLSNREAWVGDLTNALRF